MSHPFIMEVICFSHSPQGLELGRHLSFSLLYFNIIFSFLPSKTLVPLNCMWLDNSNSSLLPCYHLLTSLMYHLFKISLGLWSTFSMFIPCTNLDNLYTPDSLNAPCDTQGLNILDFSMYSGCYFIFITLIFAITTLFLKSQILILKFLTALPLAPGDPLFYLLQQSFCLTEKSPLLFCPSLSIKYSLEVINSFIHLRSSSISF